ncbi:hypothetical protein [Paenibacillus sp. P32E]|uniref:hypothetical protein n=1 Tax=Paenibacillus sp. P32E TaxID=1349434 RepID=UPI00093C1151|nr:hypothetical protein [Paenibacillus sp. P32E]OKP85939.1 hypothetical protein A3848_22050 [Paenibacillus sp. P32E]
MFDKFKEFLSRQITVEIKHPMTIVALLEGDYKAPANNRTYTLMENLARLGGDQVVIICLHQGGESGAAARVKPFNNFTVAKIGLDVRPLFQGRIIMWTDSPRYADTLRSAHPNLIVYDDREDRQEEDMYDLADIVFRYDVDQADNYIPANAAGAGKVIRIIQNTPSRKPPRQ